jgi:hypothetical protein
MFKAKSVLPLIVLMLTFNPTIAISDQHQPVYTVDLSGRWVDDKDQIDIKQSGNKVTGEIGVNRSRLSGTINGDVITLTFNYWMTDRGTGRDGVGELKISSDGTKLTGTRSGGGFRKGSEWILTKESD